MRTTTLHEYTNEERREFTRLIKDKRRVIFSVINSLGYIHEDEKDDYYQEILLYAWHRYHHFDPALSSFTTWLYKTAKWAALKYTKVVMRLRGQVRFIDNISSWYLEPDQSYNEDHIKALNLAIEDLPEDQRMVVELFLEGHSLPVMSVKEGYHPTYYTNKLLAIKKFILNHRQRYFEDLTVDPTVLSPVINVKRNEDNPLSKRVEMRDLTGGYIKTWPSIGEAERNGFSSSTIVECAQGKHLSHKGYIWCYSGQFDPTLPGRIKNNFMHNIKTVEQISPKGAVVKTYPSVRSVMKDGFSESCVRRVLLGQQASYKGFIWKYSDN